MPEPTDAAHCPICGQPNRCARAATADGAGCADCWCTKVIIPRAALDRVPAAQRGKACLCATCAGHRDDDRERG